MNKPTIKYRQASDGHFEFLSLEDKNTWVKLIEAEIDILRIAEMEGRLKFLQVDKEQVK